MENIVSGWTAVSAVSAVTGQYGQNFAKKPTGYRFFQAYFPGNCTTIRVIKPQWCVASCSNSEAVQSWTAVTELHGGSTRLNCSNGTAVQPCKRRYCSSPLFSNGHLQLLQIKNAYISLLGDNADLILFSKEAVGGALMTEPKISISQILQILHFCFGRQRS